MMLDDGSEITAIKSTNTTGVKSGAQNTAPSGAQNGAQSGTSIPTSKLAESYDEFDLNHENMKISVADLMIMQSSFDSK